MEKKKGKKGKKKGQKCITLYLPLRLSPAQKLRAFFRLSAISNFTRRHRTPGGSAGVLRRSFVTLHNNNFTRYSCVEPESYRRRISTLKFILFSCRNVKKIYNKNYPNGYYFVDACVSGESNLLIVMYSKSEYSGMFMRINNIIKDYYFFFFDFFSTS